MSLGAICLVVAAVLFFLLGFNVINSTGKIDLVLIAFGLFVTGVLLRGVVLPIHFISKE